MFELWNSIGYFNMLAPKKTKKNEKKNELETYLLWFLYFAWIYLGMSATPKNAELK